MLPGAPSVPGGVKRETEFSPKTRRRVQINLTVVWTQNLKVSQARVVEAKMQL